MRAAVTDGAGKVWLESVPEPRPDAYQCLCKMLACATCTGTDTKHIHNKLPWKQHYPGLLGHESIGRVVETGAKVRNFKVGDLVLRPTPAYPGETFAGYTSMWGGFSEYGLVTDAAAVRADTPDAEVNNYVRFQQKVPADLDVTPADWTMIITLKETASYAASVGVGLYSSVAVLGAGSVGISMCRFAKIFGAYPLIAVARRDEQLAYARDVIGADFTVNATTTDPVTAMRSLTNGAGVDVMIDTTGNAAFLGACIPGLTEAGRAAAYATYDPQDGVAQHVPADKLVTGRTGEDEANQYLIDAVRLGLVDLRTFYSHTMPFAQISEGFDLLKAKKAFKIAFEMED